MSPRRFDGWEPRMFVTRNGDGWIITREPEWDAEDRAFMYALDEYEADLCPGCGLSMTDSLHVDGQPDPTIEVQYAVCMGCKARERAMAKVEKQDAAIEKSGGQVFRAARRWLLKLRRG